MEILYADAKLAVCLKPPGVLSTDEPGGMPDLLRAELGTESIYTVHRLDAAVGGVMVYARTRHAASDLGKAIQSGAFRKEYLAVLTGVLRSREAELRDLLWRDTRQRKTFAVDAPGPGVQEAALRYSLRAEKNGLSLVSVTLLTGRTHQIRCQFSARGCPLWGDKKYGGWGEGHIALWSRRLVFAHPLTGETMDLSAPPPREKPWTDFEDYLYVNL